MPNYRCEGQRWWEYTISTDPRVNGPGMEGLVNLHSIADRPPQGSWGTAHTTENRKREAQTSRRSFHRPSNPLGRPLHLLRVRGFRHAVQGQPSSVKPLREVPASRTSSISVTA